MTPSYTCKYYHKEINSKVNHTSTLILCQITKSDEIEISMPASSSFFLVCSCLSFLLLHSLLWWSVIMSYSERLAESIKQRTAIVTTEKP